MKVTNHNATQSQLPLSTGVGIIFVGKFKSWERSSRAKLPTQKDTPLYDEQNNIRPNFPLKNVFEDIKKTISCQVLR